jgi:hypothetical protein
MEAAMNTVDRMAILDVMNRYFMSIDRRDFPRLRTCFTDDVTGIYEGVEVAGGIDEIMRFFTGESTFRFPLELTNLRASTHFIGNHYAEVAGATAVAETYALAYLIDEPSSGLRLRTRALRYRDALVLVAGAWKIRKREHLLDWTTQNGHVDIAPQ